MKILIINSDSPNNRGDRAILIGGIKLLRYQYPDADIWSLSENSQRDEEWFGIRFLPMGVYSINPLQWLRLCFFAKSCDLVVWGGGELLKDYTNKLGLIYWVIKICSIRFFGVKIYGFYQGIGPTYSTFSKKLIAYVINKTETFFTRDNESREKLMLWGVTAPVVASYDPAILCDAEPLDQNEKFQINKDFEITDHFLSNAIGIGVRNWFHYKKYSWIPFRFKKMFGIGRSAIFPKSEQYKKQLALLCDTIIKKYDINIVFFPMHMSLCEGDVQFSMQIRAYMKYKECARIVDKDTLSPKTFHSAIGTCKVFIGSRLHSFILATTAYVPAIILYYVDKGRIFAEQAGAQKYSLPIENVLDDKTVTHISNMITEVLKERKSINQRTRHHLNSMRNKLIETLVMFP